MSPARGGSLVANLLTPPIMRRIRHFVPPDAAGMADAVLLERYVTAGDEAAFESIVRRHGRMVYGVCSRLLRDPNDAQDAFQATFLVLVRKAATVSPPAMLPGWLHGVARLTALRARAAAAERRKRERAVAELPEPAARRDDGEPDLRPVLDEELARLPAKNRAAVVTCDLEGLSHKEAAARLGWPMGTVASRLSRGRAALAKRLARRGVTPPAHAALAPQLPPSLIAATLQSAELYGAGQASGTAVALTQGVLKAMSMSRLKSAVVTCVLAAALALGGAIALMRTGPEATAAAPPPASPSLTLRQAAIRTLRNAGFRVEKAGGQFRVSAGEIVGLTPKEIRPTPLEAERIAARELLNAEVAYWNLYAARRQLAAREQFVQEAREALDACEARRKAGRVTEADFYQAKGQYTLARALRSSAESQVGEDERQLRMLMGLPLQSDPPLVPGDTPSVAAVKPDWDASVQEALAARVELKMTRNDVRLSQSLHTGEKLLRAFMGMSPPVQSDLTLRLARDVETLKDQERKVIGYLGNYYRRLSLQHEQIRANQAQRKAFEEQLQARQQEFLAGRGTLDILLEAQRFSTEALAQEHQAIAAFNNSLAGFDFAKGAALKRHKMTLEAAIAR
jgi:RNA polymerase sigma factor (sigma-70 family)